MNRLKVYFRPVASADLDAIEAYIREDNPEAARKVRLAIIATADLLGNNPALGYAIKSPHSQVPAIRYHPVSGYRNFLVFYQVTPVKLRVIRILHAAQDWTRYFKRV